MIKSGLLNSATFSLILGGVCMYFSFPLQPKEPDPAIAAFQRGHAIGQGIGCCISIVLAIVAFRGIRRGTLSKLDAIPAAGGIALSVLGLIAVALVLLR